MMIFMSSFCPEIREHLEQATDRHPQAYAKKRFPFGHVGHPGHSPQPAGKRMSLDGHHRGVVPAGGGVVELFSVRVSMHRFPFTEVLP
jgi:hypothetical protein